MGLKEIISPFLSDKLTTKQQIELCHVGKFVSVLDENSKILAQRESPDFIISVDGMKVGLEHERIFKKDEVKRINSLSKLFSDSESVFRQLYPEAKVLANCILKSNIFSYTKEESPDIQIQIANYIYSLLLDKNRFEKPHFIESISLQKYSGVSINYSSGAHMVSYVDSDILESAILKKEKLYKKYQQNSDITRQWLLMVLGTKRADSYEYGDFPFSLDIETQFERIYLLEDFESKIYQLA